MNPLFGTDPWWMSALKAVAIFVVLVLLTLFNIWAERRVVARMQQRIGPNRVGPQGLLQSLMDGVKLALKEDVVPKAVDKAVFILAPIIATVPAFLTWAVIPFGPDVSIFGHRTPLQLTDFPVAVLYVLAIASVGIYGIVLAGWSSGSTYPLLGGLRSTAQMISYEIAMGLALVGVVLTYDTLDLQQIARAQGHLIGGWLPAWGILYQPIGFLVFLVGGIAESKRTPFDLPESESELISGYFTEYSGAKHFMFFMSDFVEVVLVAALVTTLYFGGWQVPYLLRDGFHFPWGSTLALPALAVSLLGVVAFIVKLVFFTILQILLRWTLPRFRYDQLMQLGWKGLLPVSLANVVATAALVLLAGPRA